MTHLEWQPSLPADFPQHEQWSREMKLFHSSGVEVIATWMRDEEDQLYISDLRPADTSSEIDTADGFTFT